MELLFYMIFPFLQTVNLLYRKKLNDNKPEEGTDYIKFPDGTLIQWGQVYFPSVVSGGEGYGVATFSIPFSSNPRMSATPRYGGSSSSIFDVSVQVSAGYANIYARTNSGGLVGGAYADWIAIGTWK